MVVRALAAVGITALVAGCGSVPSYYSERVSGQRAYTANTATPAAYEEAEPAPRPRTRRVARRKQHPTETVAAPANASPETQVARTGSTENTGNTGSATVERLGVRRPPAGTAAEVEEAKARTARREQAISRSINSICQGC